jgi:predicted transcriptional regulator
MDAGTPLETIEISYGDLPLQVMILSLAISISPIIGLPIELLLFIKLFTYLGIRRITKNNIFDNDVRNQIYTCIRNNPGIFLDVLSQKTGMKPGTLKHHLAILKIMGKILLSDTRGHTRYFENSGKYSPLEQTVIKYCNNDTDRMILETLLQSPEISRKDLVENLCISGPTVTWHMQRLRNEHIIFVQSTGRYVRYEINPEVILYLEKHLPRYKESHSLTIIEGISESV